MPTLLSLIIAYDLINLFYRHEHYFSFYLSIFKSHIRRENQS